MVCLRQYYTLAHWIYFDISASVSGWRTSFSGVNADWIRIKATSNQRYTLGSFLKSDANWFSSQVEVLKGQWQLIVLVGEGSSTSISYGDVAGKTRIYIGNQEMSPVLAANIDQVHTGDCLKSIGHDNQSPGMISEFVIWNKALTTSQINGFWQKTKYTNLINEKLHVVNWGTQLNDYYYTNGVLAKYWSWT